MKKKSLIAFVMSLAFAFSAFGVVGCNVKGNGGGTSTEEGGNQGGDQGGDQDQTVKVSGVSLNKEALTLNKGASEKLVATVSPDNATNKGVSWKSDNVSVATVSGDGTVTAIAKGSATITVATADGGYTKTCTVTVNEVDQTVAVSGVSLNKSTLTLNTGASEKLVATVTPTNATNKGVSWKSDNTSVATVSSDGLVTAIAKGSANVTVTTADGGYTKTCQVTVNEVDKTVKVDGVSITPATLSLNVGSNSALTANVSPSDAANKNVSWKSDNTAVATVDNKGVVTAKSAGGANITVTTEDGNYTAKCVVTVKAVESGDLTLTYTYAGNECASFEWTDSAPANAKVEYKLSTESNYKTLDSQLVRKASTSGTARADVIGLKGGANYDFVITASTGKKITTTQTISAYDRSGYAHFNYSDGVGAYNNDGTPKANAQIIYVTEETKNTVTANIGGKNYTGLVNILGNLKSSKNPVIVRVIGTIGAATWNKIDYNADKKYSGSNKIPAEKVIGVNGKQLPTDKNTTQADLIAGGYNTLNTSVYSELKGLDSRAKYTAEKTDSNGKVTPAEYDTIWNNCPIKEAKNVTLEGIGEDARLFQWGITWGSCNSIEVRNLTFEDYPEDACAFEGTIDDKNGPKGETIDDFNSKHLWLHHNTFEEGMNYWDLTAEQDKHEGDGATDFKQLSYITTSYNVHHKNHKTGLVGGGDTVKTACVSFHHNYYNNNSSRLPLGRQANMHMYNNYYYKSTGTNMSLRAGAYALIENCYFENANVPIEIKTGDGKTGAAKLLGNVFEGKKYSSNSHIYEVTDRSQKVANDNRYNQNFDTDASAFYYDATNKCSKVAVMYTAEETKVNVPKLAGVQKRNGTVAIDPEGGNQGGGSETPDPTPTPTPEPDPTPTTIPTYEQLLAKENKVYGDDFSSTADGTKFAEFSGYDTAGIFSQPDSTQGYASSYTEVRGGKTQQVTNVGVSDIATGGKNTTTVVAFGAAQSVIEGYFEITTTDIGTKWDVIKFVDSKGTNKFAVRIDTDKTKDLTYTVNSGTAVTPTQSFVWTKNVVYKVYFKLDLSSGKMSINITDGSAVYSVSDITVDTGIKGIQLISSNKGQRYTSIDNVVVCAS